MGTVVEAAETRIVLKNVVEPGITLKNVDVCGRHEETTLVLELCVEVSPQALVPFLQAVGRINHWEFEPEKHGDEGDEESFDYLWTLTLERGPKRHQAAPPPPADAKGA